MPLSLDLFHDPREWLRPLGVIWTPMILFLDRRGEVRYRSPDFLPPIFSWSFSTSGRDTSHSIGRASRRRARCSAVLPNVSHRVPGPQRLRTGGGWLCIWQHGPAQSLIASGPSSTRASQTRSGRPGQSLTNGEDSQQPHEFWPMKRCTEWTSASLEDRHESARQCVRRPATLIGAESRTVRY